MMSTEKNPSRPRTSSNALQTWFEALGLEVELWGDASDDFEEVFSSVLAWYADSGRAKAARVFSFAVDDETTTTEVFASARFSELTQVLPELKGEELLGYVGDRLLIDAVHPLKAGHGAQLFILTASPGNLYLLRTDDERTAAGAFARMPRLERRSSSDTEAALSGLFRGNGCSPVYEAHAKRCPRCVELLARSRQRHELPSGWPSVTEGVPPAAPAKQEDLPGVQVTRNFIGNYRVELPMLPNEVARRLEEIREGVPWVVLRREFSIALGEETRLEVSHMRPPVLVLEQAARAELIDTLEAQQEPELEYGPSSTTFVFKPLASSN